jgi:two-component system, chemotaxis family, sensor kinase Cph1
VSASHENEAEFDSAVDLTNCDREPIHVPAAIQPHGVLFALHEEDLVCHQVSNNTAEFLGISATDLLGNSISLVLGAAQTEAFRQTLSTTELRSRNPMKLLVPSANGKERLVNGITHRHQGILFLELEPCDANAESPLRAFQRFQSAMVRLQKTVSLSQLWRVVAEEVRSILEFDRVMVYRFDRDGHGEVIEEEVVEGKERFIGLHYPASDIPQQARLLYTINYIRHIPDVSYKSAQLIPLIYPPSKELTDMSFCTLRSVSPIHIEYLQNMGVAASLSVSLISGATLWGLIACHNYRSKFIPYEMRSACEMLGQVVSLRVAALESMEGARGKSGRNTMQARFLEALSSKMLRDALIAGTPNVRDYVPCDGAALYMDKQCYPTGTVPSTQQIDRLVKRIRRSSSPVFATNHLSSIYAEAIEFQDTASGVLCLTISRERNIYLLWFRGEQLQTVDWAGVPGKEVLDESGTLRPRKSFALWREVVKNKSLPWTDEEIQAATELRSTLMGLLLREN